MTAARGTVLIMAGGTGGHIMPGLAVASVLQACGWKVFWLGSPDRMEGRLVPGQGYPLLPLRFAGVRGRGWRPFLLLPLTLARACLQVRRHLTACRPDVALGLGGYVAFPGGLMSWFSGVPLVVHEQNAVAGTANRFLARLARRRLTGFPDVLPRADVVGNPVREAFLQTGPVASRYAARQGPLRVLVMGGSQGSAFLNALMPEALGCLPESERPEVLHQAGARHADEVRAQYARRHVSARVEAFVAEVATEMAAADLLICRAGAMTVAEVAAVGVAALFVPFPHAIDDHQAANARFLSGQGGGWMMRESALTAASLATWLRARHRAELAQVAASAHAQARPDAAQAIARACVDVRGETA